jgi:hypothetical protein
MDYWQKREDNGDLSLCTVDIHLHGGSIGFGRSYRGRTSIELFDVLKSLNGHLDKDVDIKTFYPTIGIGYTVEFKDGSEFGLSRTNNVLFTFYYDFEYVVPSGYAFASSKIYKIENPDVLRQYLSEKGFYVSPQTEELLKEKTDAFYAENDSLMKVAENCEWVLLRECTDDESPYIEKVPTTADDFTFETDGRFIDVYPARLKSISDATYADADYCSTIYIPVEDNNVRLDLLFRQDERTDLVIHAAIITKDIPLS